MAMYKFIFLSALALVPGDAEPEVKGGIHKKENCVNVTGVQGLQHYLDDASIGCIRMMGGAYNLEFGLEVKRAVLLTSEETQQPTVLNLTGTGSVVLVREGGNLHATGLSITGGNGPVNGGGVSVEAHANATLTNCRVYSNKVVSLRRWRENRCITIHITLRNPVTQCDPCV